MLLLQACDVLVKYFLGVFAKLRRTPVSFVMSVHVEHLGSHWTDFLEIFRVLDFSKVCLENSGVIKI